MVPPGFFGVERGVPTVPKEKAVFAKVIYPQVSFDDSIFRKRVWDRMGNLNAGLCS